MAGRRGPALILTYHRVNVGRDPLSQCVRPDRFESHLARLARLADVVPLAALDDPAPSRRIAITFDDGYADNAATAAPLLRSAGLPATFFVTGRVVDDPREYWWDVLEHAHLDAPAGVSRVRAAPGGRPVTIDVRSPAGLQRSLKALNRRLRVLAPEAIAPVVAEVGRQLGADPDPRCAAHALLDRDAVAALVAAGFEVGSHAMTHTMLSALPPVRQRAELEDSRRRLEEVTGGSVTSLAYPYGTADSFTTGTERLARRAGYARACANTPGALRPWRRPFALPRHMVYDWEADELAAHVNAWFDRA